ncbi:hypothetical protein K438DRAFT_1963024 [Mycena galopus ATCC 62051]|nr:hypothetical protein K438DRAFT_1963024 [Mycena galopus ATCC 62051]
MSGVDPPTASGRPRRTDLSTVLRHVSPTAVTATSGCDPTWSTSPRFAATDLPACNKKPTKKPTAAKAPKAKAIHDDEGEVINILDLIVEAQEKSEEEEEQEDAEWDEEDDDNKENNGNDASSDD